jgi:putative membrane protein
MMILLRWVLGALAVMLVTWIVPGITIENFWIALVVALVLGLLNAIVRPVLVLLTLPVTLLTLGLFVLVINAVVFLLASALVPGFEVDGFWAAFIGAILMAIVVWAVNTISGKK